MGRGNDRRENRKKERTGTREGAGGGRRGGRRETGEIKRRKDGKFRRDVHF